MLSIGIVGLPNVGKSTLFNALTKSKQADAQNYPFCTIEPNIGVVEVPDDRLSRLAAVSKSKKIVPTAIEFVDIAGLVKGASEGEGLGNTFLSHIREVNAIAQVVRAFTDPNVTHVHNNVDPKNDSDIINLELVLADWQTVNKRLEKTEKAAKGANAKPLETERTALQKLSALLEQGKPAREGSFTEDEMPLVRELCLLTLKPMMYIVNVDESDPTARSIDRSLFGANTHVVPISAKLEAELADLSPEDAENYMKDLGITKTGLDKIILAGYELLNLVTFLTSGEPETRAWTVTRGTKGPQAAGVIHTDFIKGYIKADVTKWQDFVVCNGWNGVKEQGKMRLEGKEYIVEDGDVVYFHVAT
ncbi:MAG: GTP-binding protein YchF [Candidatus Magasanikbacteria bacterium GW2011_GWA2_46_17]|uniref:Ribosome-binding ATPase YchF n=1 Tax=Candidatus Magasanikbacteria bacterium GW2011_GWA2_46_17 TaxID=1619042 RepID=A0A0G1P2H0_9BACT|nr:MAG: GTP-binding protein YchF [Candidatus Magasanikbacteria bacterium GW2011_GWA2_46_17]